ncbi:hypothetical protein, partial [Xylella fastidiosa]|uniref:hypothetical protein n=1 Tax=Xylella fastidiosa TaxID=2371 RepID=UPI001EE9E3A0
LATGEKPVEHGQQAAPYGDMDYLHACSSPPIVAVIDRSAGNDGRAKGATAGGRTGERPMRIVLLLIDAVPDAGVPP